MNTPTRELASRRPRDFDRWVIPFGVLVSIALVVAAIVILVTDRDPAISTIELAVFTGASMAAVTCVVYARDYVLQRANAADHRALRDEVRADRTAIDQQFEELRGLILELRSRAVTASGETRTLLEQISTKQTDQNHLVWQSIAEHLGGEGGSTVPFRRRS